MEFHVYSYAQLSKDLSRRQIDENLAAGYLERVARGWYAEPGAKAEVITAIQNHARLGCATGCRLYGVWAPRVSGCRGVCGPGSARPSGYHRSTAPLPSGPVWDLDDCIAQAVKNHSTEVALIVVESALNLQKISHAAAVHILNRSGQRGAKVLKHLGAAESGSETRVRLFLRGSRVKVREQVHIPTVGRVDLLVGANLIIECDSVAYHSSPEQYREDRCRDIAARRLGYDVMRLSYEQIWSSWEETKEVLRASIRLRKHRHLPRAII